MENKIFLAIVSEAGLASGASSLAYFESALKTSRLKN
jgi:hypothetical protein